MTKAGVLLIKADTSSVTYGDGFPSRGSLFGISAFFPAYLFLKGVSGMEKENAQNRSGIVKNHLLTMENRRRVALTGVNEVLGFDENQVSLMTENGEVTLTGEGLHVTKLMLEEGQLAVEGKIDGIQYSAQRARRRGLFGRSSDK